MNRWALGQTETAVELLPRRYILEPTRNKQSAVRQWWLRVQRIATSKYSIQHTTQRCCCLLLSARLFCRGVAGKCLPMSAARGKARSPEEAHGSGPPGETGSRPRRAVHHQGPRHRSTALHGKVCCHYCCAVDHSCGCLRGSVAIHTDTPRGCERRACSCEAVTWCHGWFSARGFWLGFCRIDDDIVGVRIHDLILRLL